MFFSYVIFELIRLKVRIFVCFIECGIETSGSIAITITSRLNFSQTVWLSGNVFAYSVMEFFSRVQLFYDMYGIF